MIRDISYLINKLIIRTNLVHAWIAFMRDKGDPLRGGVDERSLSCVVWQGNKIIGLLCHLVWTLKGPFSLVQPEANICHSPHIDSFISPTPLPLYIYKA